MELLVLLVVLALLGWLAVNAVRSLRTQVVGPLWWATLFGSALVGVVVRMRSIDRTYLWLSIVIPCVLALLSLIAVRSLLARRVGCWWWVALFGCIAVGVALGVWFTFFFEDNTDPNMRYIGFPLPWNSFVRFPDGVGGEWTQYKRMEDDAVLDMLLFSSISVYPVWLVNSLWRLVRGRSKMGRSKS